jgi:hypothetical protein
MPNDGIRLKIILIIEVRKLEFTDFDSHSQIFKNRGQTGVILSLVNNPPFEMGLLTKYHRFLHAKLKKFEGKLQEKTV